MQVLTPRLIPVSQLHPAPINPKKEISKDQLAGLRASIAEFGFADVLQVARDQKGYTVLDGNSRLEELKAAGVTEVPVIELEALAWDKPDAELKRVEFALTFDANRKSFDPKERLKQLQNLAAHGRDVKKLQTMTGMKKLEKQLDTEATARVQATLADAASKAATTTMESLVLYGPVDDINGIRLCLANLKARLTDCRKVQSLLAEANQCLDLEDESFLTVFLGALARYRNQVLTTPAEETAS